MGIIRLGAYYRTVSRLESLAGSPQLSIQNGIAGNINDKGNVQAKIIGVRQKRCGGRLTYFKPALQYQHFSYRHYENYN